MATNVKITKENWVGGTVIETVSGRAYDYLNPDPDQIDLEDIAHGLSMTCRFGGHSKFFYSVAEHSVLVSKLVEAWGGVPHQQLGALFHDAHEYVTCDVPTPMKRALRAAADDGSEEPPDVYNVLVAYANEAIAKAFALEPEWFEGELVREADHAALFVEAELLLPDGPGAPSRAVPDGLSIRGQLPEHAKLSFEARAQVLFERRRDGG